MIRYTPSSQISLEGFETPFHQQLDASNRWVVLCKRIPWDKLAAIYYRNMRADFGAPALSARMVIGAVIIKHMLNIDDREVVEQIRENMYLQYFVGLSSFQTSAPFDASLMVSIRKRLGKDAIDQFNEEVLREAGILSKTDAQPSKQSGDDNDEHGDDQNAQNHNSASNDDVQQHQQPLATDQAIPQDQAAEQYQDTPKPADNLPLSGTLLVDATVAEQQIEYPTDLKLLNQGREQLERMIAKVCDDLCIAQPRIYKYKARERYLLIAKKKRKTKSQLRRGIRQQLQYVKRDLACINKLVQKYSPLYALSKRDWHLIRVISELWRQQKEMYRNQVNSIEDRIVSIYQPYVRPMPRGKDKAATEFGSKQLVMLKDGYTHVQSIGWDNFHEGSLLEPSVEAYKGFYGCYPEAVSADRIFGSRDNRKYLKDKGIRFIGKALGRPPATSPKQDKALQREMAGRNTIEGKFGQGKNGYGLAKIKARLKDTAESWIMSIYFVMNLVKLASQASFLPFLRWIYSVIELCRQYIFNRAVIDSNISMLPLRVPIKREESFNRSKFNFD